MTESKLHGQSLDTTVISTVGAWTAFTPSWTNLTPGSGTNTGAYVKVGKIVFFRVYFQYGSGSSVGTTPGVTLPVAVGGSSVPFVNAIVNLEDSGTGNFDGTIDNSGYIYYLDPSGALLIRRTLTATVPWTWTTNDSISISGFYESA